ncbi:MAG TPA: serine/threonine-protein kinase [Gemmatimonas sp.]|nr:serine/threonine-protein kinase [Gemmatimonas sp.]
MLSSTESPASGEIASLRAALRGQYDIQRELGRGGMGIVLLARDERLDRQVALKVLPPGLADQAETRERFLREARMAAQLSHPNIVPVHRADDIGGFAFFAMGYVDGDTLADRIRDRGALPPADVIRVLREVAWALAYAHARGIVHRDVKPENILIERSTGRAIVTDFGIARADFHPSLTQDGHVLGTVHYMSPEQSSGEAVDGRSDLYALGCVGFLALSGRLPFEGTSPQAILIAHATKQPPLLRDVAASLPPALASVIDRCLLKSPDDRFSTGEELADALGKAMGALESSERESQNSAIMSSDEAMAVWRRAAELQAEAATRLESRMREATETRRAGAGAEGKTSVEPVSDVVPTDAYRVSDVEAAAKEVGISHRYVALAMAELKTSSDAVARVQPIPQWKDRMATRLLGTSQRTLSVSRVFRFAPRVVLQAVGRSLQAHPYSLALRDTLGGHPLDGGVLVFDLPAYTDSNYRWTWTRYGVYVPEIRVTFASVAGDPRACEVSMHLDLRRGMTVNLAGYTAGTGLGTATGAAAGAVVGKAAMTLAGAALIGPALGGAIVLGLAAVACVGPLYRWEIRKATTELETALAAVEAGIRAKDIFGEAPPARPVPVQSDSSWMTGL